MPTPKFPTTVDVLVKVVRALQRGTITGVSVERSGGAADRVRLTSYAYDDTSAWDWVASNFPHGDEPYRLNIHCLRRPGTKHRKARFYDQMVYETTEIRYCWFVQHVTHRDPWSRPRRRDKSIEWFCGGCNQPLSPTVCTQMDLPRTRPTVEIS